MRTAIFTGLGTLGGILGGYAVAWFANMRIDPALLVIELSALAGAVAAWGIARRKRR